MLLLSICKQSLKFVNFDAIQLNEFDSWFNDKNFFFQFLIMKVELNKNNYLYGQTIHIFNHFCPFRPWSGESYKCFLLSDIRRKCRLGITFRGPNNERSCWKSDTTFWTNTFTGKITFHISFDIQKLKKKYSGKLKISTLKWLVLFSAVDGATSSKIFGYAFVTNDVFTSSWRCLHDNEVPFKLPNLPHHGKYVPPIASPFCRHSDGKSTFCC